MPDNTVDSLVLAQLAAHALNHLDGWEEPQDEMGCCPVCCAPCAALKALLEAGRLDDAVRPFVQCARLGWEWWVNDAVDRRWLERGWRHTDCHAVGIG